jgi:nitrate reductase delta subunit
MLVFRAFSALLSYPSEEMRQALPEITDVILAAQIVAPRERQHLLDLIDELRRDELLAAE